jgi:hypothetical protein
MSNEAFHLPKEEANKLFKLINKRDWKRVESCVKRSPNFAKELCTVPGFYEGKFSSCMPAIHLACALEAPVTVLQGLHAAWTEGLAEPESTYGRLPLHIAVMFGMPCDSLNCLIKMHPKALKIQDAHGRLPIHYGCKSNGNSRDEKNALSLLKAYVDCVMVADLNGFLPLHVACRSANSLPLIRMLIRCRPETIVRQTLKGNTAIDCARNSRYGTEESRAEIVGILERAVQEFHLRIPQQISN